MAKEDVVFKVSAEEAQAIDAFRKLVVSQGQVKDSTEKTNRSVGKQGDAWKTTTVIMAGVVTAGVALGKMFVGDLIGSMEKTEQATLKLKDALVPLLALGSNSTNIGNIRTEVLAVATAFGLAADEVARLQFNIESAGASFDPKMQKDVRDAALQLTWTYGGAADTNALLMSKAMEIYGPEFKAKSKELYGDELHAAKIAQAQLATIAEKGATTPAEFAQYAPNLMADAKASGASFPEFGAAFIKLSQKGGGVAESATAGRSMFTKNRKFGSMAVPGSMQNIDLSGPLANDMRQIAKLTVEQRAEGYGEERMGTLSMFAEAADEIEMYTKQLENVAYDDPVSRKEINMMRDPALRNSMQTQMIKAAQENFYMYGEGSKVIRDRELARLGFMVENPNLAGGSVEDAAVYADMVTGGKYKNRGVRELQFDTYTGGRSMMGDVLGADNPPKPKTTSTLNWRNPSTYFNYDFVTPSQPSPQSQVNSVLDQYVSKLEENVKATDRNTAALLESMGNPVSRVAERRPFRTNAGIGD